jgi:hypothetical protein
MALEPTSFRPHSITDTCAVWNILSSPTLYAAASFAGCHFACTGYVLYECLFKPRKVISDADRALVQRLLKEREKGCFRGFELTLDDLADVAVLERRWKLGKGELSSIAFARKHRQAYLTDDQKGRRLAEQVCEEGAVQTTPKLLGWLFYEARLLDGDLELIIREHESMNRPLQRYFRQMYLRALEFRARDATSG